MTREQALKELKECKQLDTECAHSVGDEVLCKLLRALGYDDVVNAWEELDKWYA